MPVTKSAKKKLRQDKKRTEINKKMKNLLKNVIKEAKKLPSLKTISKAAKIADKAAKLNIIHKKKAARLKSSLSKLLDGKPATTVKKAETPSKKSKKVKTPTK